MTEKANPSINRPAEAFKTAGAIALGGGSADGYISPSSSPSEISIQDSGISESNLNAFTETSSGTSFDVDISGGEAFIYGAWIVIDTVTTVTLASSTNNQTVYAGWNKDGSDDVIVGLQSTFDSATGNTDQKIPLYDFDTDGSGVTNVTDRRTIGKTLDGRFVQNTNTVSSSYTTSGEQLIFVDTSSNTVTITLATTDLDDGSEVIVVDSGGNASTNNITIDTEGSASIDGASSVTISSDNGAKAIGTDGTNWYTTGAGSSSSSSGGATAVDGGTITLSTSSTPAFDGTITNVSTTETDKVEDVEVYIDSSGQVASDYAYNWDWGQQWDDTNGELDVNLTVNWDNDPGSNLTAHVEVLLQ